MTQPAPARPAGLRLGLRANLAQFSLLVGVNALVGGMVGQERSLLSLLATEVFGLAAVPAALTYIVAFGLIKAATNFLAGALADRYGRKPVLVAGWLVGLPVPLLIIWAPTWGWIVVANVLLGVNQGLCWSTTVIMKIDLAGPERRGLAMGLNEAAGYLAVGVTAYLTGLIAARAGLRPEPFYMPATTGKPGHETPSGLHKIEWRWPGWHVSTKYPENGQMYQSQYFGPGIALHGVPSHEVHKQPSSHGCVRLYPSDANTLYRDLKVGIPVWVTGRFRYPA